MEDNYVIEMRGITKIFPGIIANDHINLALKKGEIHALLGENGAGKSTLMSVLFGLYQPEEGQIFHNGKEVKVTDPNVATSLGIGMVHQHFKLVECFSVMDNIILGNEDTSMGFIQKKKAREKVKKLSDTYGLHVDLDAKVSDITVGMQQRTEILKMLYRDNDILIFDEPTAVLTPQEIEELMQIMRNLKNEGKSILFISHKLNEIMAISDRCTILRKGKYIGTVNIKDTNKEELSSMMVGRDVKFAVDKTPAKPGKTVLKVQDLVVKSKLHKKNAVDGVSIHVNAGEIVCIAGIDGNGQTEFVHALTGLDKVESGEVIFMDEDITKKSIHYKNTHGFAHIPEEVREYAQKLIDEYDVRSGQGPVTIARSMSGGNQQKAICAREMDREHDLLIAVQPTRGLDVGAIEAIHTKIVKKRDEGDAILLVSLELDEVMNLSDRIYVMYEGKIVGELDPKKTTVQELGLYMSGAKKDEVKE